MVGFIKGLVGSRAKKAPIDAEAEIAKQKKAEAYFLDADAAKTLGDIDYMRTAKTVRRTFPKTLSTGKVSEKIQMVSSMEMAPGAKPIASIAQPAPVTPPVSKVEDTSVERRRTDTSMDMFRNMARDMKKR